MKLQVDQAELIDYMKKTADYTLEMDLVWDWPMGVAMYGVSRAYEVTGDPYYLDKMKVWVDEYIALGVPNWTVNTCAMGHMLLTIYEHTQEEKYMEIIESKLHYLRQQAPRFGEQVLQHTVSIRDDFPQQCWADTLFMAAYFMLRAGIMLQDKPLIEDALRQFYWHIVYLQDEDEGLWYHGYNHLEQHHMSAIFWARGNAWAAYTMSRVQTILPEGYLYPDYMYIGSALRDQLAALKKYQAADGLWPTVLSRADAYGEASATAGIAAAMITQGNPLHTKYAQRALAATLHTITAQGKVTKVSGGTAVMNNVEDYMEVTNDWAQGWGQGLALAALAAAYERVAESED